MRLYWRALIGRTWRVNPINGQPAWRPNHPNTALRSRGIEDAEMLVSLAKPKSYALAKL